MSLIEFMPDGSRRAYSPGQWLSRSQWGKILGVPDETVKRVTEMGIVRVERGESQTGKRTVITPVEDFPKLVLGLASLKSTSDRFLVPQDQLPIQIKTSLGTTLMFPVENKRSQATKLRIADGMRAYWKLSGNDERKRKLSEQMKSEGWKKLRAKVADTWKRPEYDERRMEVSKKVKDRWKKRQAKKKT